MLLDEAMTVGLDLEGEHRGHPGQPEAPSNKGDVTGAPANAPPSDLDRPGLPRCQRINSELPSAGSAYGNTPLT